MGFFRKLLEDHGYIEKSKGEQPSEEKPQPEQPAKGTQDTQPAFFPVHGKPHSSPSQMMGKSTGSTNPFNIITEEPDPAFIKFFEDEMGERNPPGLDYFEFRQQYAIMKQRMPSADPNVILLAVITNFETNDVKAKDLLISASFYKGLLTDKKNMFLQDSANEKKQLLSQREKTVNTHVGNIEAKKAEAESLQQRLQEIEYEIQEEQTKMDLARTAGNEMIEEFNKAELKLKAACEHMLRAIDADIETLSSVS